MRPTLRAALPCLLAFALLVPTLDAQSLWWDEGISLHLARAPWAEVIADRAANIHPPLYFFALKVWVALAGHSPFAARYFSALPATLLPAAAYAFLRRRLASNPQSTARAGALLVALAPPFMIYGQETRAYAWLPLLALALLAQVWPARGRAMPPALHRPGRLALTQALFVLTHYAGAPAVAWVNAALLLHLLRARDRRAWRAWGASVALTALFALPWALPVAAAGAVGFAREAGLGNALAEPVPAAYLLRLLGVFHALGMPAALRDAALIRPALLTGGLMVLALAWSLLRRAGRARRGAALALLLAWLLPLAVAPLIWRLSPQAHPRYLLPFVLPAWMLLAALSTARAVPWLLRRGLLAAALALCIVGLRAYLFEPAYARTDVRGAAAWIRAEARPGDVALVPHTDAALLQYDLGAARGVMLPSPADDAAVAAALSAALRPGARAFALDYARGALDPRAQARALLEWAGWPVERHALHGVFVEAHALATEVAPAPCAALAPACVEGRGPCLAGAAIQPHPESGAALPVTLCWGAAPAPEARYALGLALYTPEGTRVAGADALLLDAQGRPTELWAAEPVTTYHLLPLPVGLLPRAYRLEAAVYAAGAPAAPGSWVREGRAPAPALPLGEVVPAVAPWLEPSAYGLALDVGGPAAAMGPSLRLEGARIDRAEAYPGQRVYVTLRARAGAALESPPDLRLALRQGARVLAEVPLLADLPPIPAERPLLEHAALTVPAEAADGPAAVVLAAPGTTVALGTVALRAGEHVFAAPPVAHPLEGRAGDVATLLGLDLEPGSTPRSGDPVTLTLVWRAEAGAAAADLTVFVHLVGEDGSIVAQHDGKPVGAQRPTAGWLAGEVLRDVHRLDWKRAYTGPATLRVGLYDAATGARVPWDTGDDALTLPLSLDVEPAR